MFSLDHFSLSARNLYEAAFRLRRETGLGFYDGGYTETGLASKVFPLGGGAYLIVEGLVDPFAAQDPANAGARRFYDGVKGGDAFRGVALRVDSLEDLGKVAAAHGAKPPVLNPNGGRFLPNGDRLVAAGTPGTAEAWPKGLPIWNYFPDMPGHPSGQPVVAAPGLVKPRGVAWVEVGGDEAALTRWIGAPAAGLGFRFNGKPAGLYAVAVKTDTGEIVVRRPPMDAADRA